MADFDFHRRRLRARLRVIGSDPAAARALLRRWRAASGLPPETEPAPLRLPAVPLADLAGFDVEVEAEGERAAGAWAAADADGYVLVVGPSRRGPADLRRLERRAGVAGEAAPILWASARGWTEEIAEEARPLGIGDDFLRREVESREGALDLLEIAVACLVDHVLLRIHPAASGEGALDSGAVIRRVRAWARRLAEARAAVAAGPAEGGGGRTAGTPGAGSASPDEPWRRRALELEGIEPLPAADAAREIHALHTILSFPAALPAGGAGADDGERLETEDSHAWRRR